MDTNLVSLPTYHQFIENLSRLDGLRTIAVEVTANGEYLLGLKLFVKSYRLCPVVPPSREPHTEVLTQICWAMLESFDRKFKVAIYELHNNIQTITKKARAGEDCKEVIALLIEHHAKDMETYAHLSPSIATLNAVISDIRDGSIPLNPELLDELISLFPNG